MSFLWSAYPCTLVNSKQNILTPPGRGLCSFRTAGVSLRECAMAVCAQSAACKDATTDLGTDCSDAASNDGHFGALVVGAKGLRTRGHPCGTSRFVYREVLCCRGALERNACARHIVRWEVSDSGATHCQDARYCGLERLLRSGEICSSLCPLCVCVGAAATKLYIHALGHKGVRCWHCFGF